ncbi:MAG TPA: Crp/Fnr family transcriptional regulator [Polyangiaceae bacterium]|nr:Crp/Fnr family transcriptional regulator [Polyangiaceae bacterium]
MTTPSSRVSAPLGSPDSAPISAELEVLGALAPRFGCAFRAGEVLYAEGEPADRAFLLLSGRVRIVKRVRQAERSVSVARAGELLGEAALLEGLVRTQTAVALADGTALAFDRASFRETVMLYPALGARVCEQMISRVRDSEDQLEVITLRDTQCKIVRALVKLARGQEGAVLELSPIELSARVGLDVDTVKRTVLRLREQHYLRIVGEKIEILERDALNQLSTLLDAKEELRGAT